MGGYGSGRRHRHANKTTDFLKLDLAVFKSEGFNDRRSGYLVWTFASGLRKKVRYQLSPGALDIRYTIPDRGGARLIGQCILLTTTAQHFGGERRWFVCPTCERRCRVLLGGNSFECRSCRRATYECQYEKVRVPGLAKTRNRRLKLGGVPGIGQPFPGKPKGMHWRTYHRLVLADWAAERDYHRVWTRELGILDDQLQQLGLSYEKLAHSSD